MVSKRHEDIVWLHLSDAHLCSSKTGWDAERVLNTLRTDLVQMMEKKFDLRRPDLIFFTGDIVYGNLPDAPIAQQFNAAQDFFEQLCSTTKVPKINLFIVPGNHDTNRTLVAESETQWLDSLSATRTGREANAIDTLIRDSGLQWQRFAERLGDYRKFLETAEYSHLLKDITRLIHYNIRTLAGVRVGIAGLNSAWSCCRDKEKGKLWFSRWQIDHLYKEIQKAHFTIALTHHPFNWFTEYEDPQLLRVLENTFQFHLHGHEHQGWVNISPSHVRIAAGACYESSTQENGYSVVRLFPYEGRGEVFLRRYDKDGGGWIPRIVHGKTDNDGRWPLENLGWLSPSTKTKRDAKTAHGGSVTAQVFVSKSANEASVLAVLPFRQPPGGLLDDWLVEGFCDDIISSLSKLRDLRIISPESTRQVRQPKSSPIAIGRKLGAGLVLTGSLRAFADSLRLNVHLNEVKTGFTLWSEAYEFKRHELVNAQITVATSVAGALKVKLSPSEAANLRKHRTESIQAYEFYLHGVRLVSTNRERDLLVGLSMFNKAIELDQNFADAYAFKGYALWRQYFSGWNADINTVKDGLECTQRALELDSSSAVARMAFIRICWDLGWHEQALTGGRQAYKDNSGSIETQLALARAYNNAGMADKAIPLTQQVLAVDPMNPTARKLLIWNHVMVTDYKSAVALAEAYLKFNPEDANTTWAAAIAYMHLENFETAIEKIQTGLQADRSNCMLCLLLGYAYRSIDDEVAALRAWENGIEAVRMGLGLFEKNHRVRAWLAVIEAATDHRDKALADVNLVYQAEPENSYLLYRLAHVYAELEMFEEAIQALTSAIEHGFLSVQIMRCEEILALKKLIQLNEYQTLVRKLERHVDSLKSKYSLGKFQR